MVWFSPTLFPSSSPGRLQLFLCPPHCLLSCYSDFPLSFVPNPWHVFWNASVHVQQGSCITDLSVFLHRSCCICLLINIFPTYRLSPFLQLYIFLPLSWVLCRRIRLSYVWCSWVSSNLKLTIKNSCSNHVIKIQCEPLWTALWRPCQPRTSSPLAQLGEPKAEGLSLPEP